MNIFANKESQQNSFIEECGLTADEAARFKANPNKFIDEEACDDEFEMCGETRALLDGEADKTFWWALKVIPTTLIILAGIIFWVGK